MLDINEGTFTTIDSLRANALITLIILSVSLFVPWISEHPSSQKRLTRALLARTGSFSLVTRSGHPPRTVRPISFSSVGASTAWFSNSPSKSPISDTVPMESKDSYSDIGRMSIVQTLPMPEWSLFLRSFSGSESDSHRMYCPFSPVLSTMKRTSSQRAGTACHSSMSLGDSPFNAMERSNDTNSQLLPSSRISLLHSSLHIRVFPQPFGPRTLTHPNVRRQSWKTGVMRRGYPGGATTMSSTSNP